MQPVTSTRDAITSILADMERRNRFAAESQAVTYRERMALGWITGGTVVDEVSAIQRFARNHARRVRAEARRQRWAAFDARPMPLAIGVRA